MHSESCFVTLTYEDRYLSNVWWLDEKRRREVLLPSLNPSHLRNFLKRLRRRGVVSKLRFFAVGEYGEVSWRPHYHLIVYGMETCEHGRTKRDFVHNRVDPNNCCARCRLVYDIWGKGDIELGTANPESMGYCSSYVLKGIFGDWKNVRLRGRYPEFSRKSNRPGIGAGFMEVLADSLAEYGVGKDVPTSLRHGSSVYPLTRYLRNKLRVLVGREEGAPDDVLMEMAHSLREMRESAGIVTFEDWKIFAADAITAGVANVKARSEIYRKRRAI